MKISLKSFVVVYFLMFALVCLTKARLPPQKQKRNLSGAVIKIIEDVWSKTEITVNLLMATEDPRNLRQFDTINELVVGTGTFYAVALRIESLSSVRTPRRPKRCNVLVVETFLDFVKAYEAINPERFKFDGLFLIVFVKGRVAETATVFDLLWKIQIFNIDVAYEDDNGTAVIETYFPFNTAKCGETKPAVINTFKSGKFASDSNLLYPDKLKNLHECPVRVGTSNNSMPYIFADRLENGTYHLHGRDIELLKTLSNALNFKIDFVYVGEEGSLLDNGTASGAFKMLLERKADLIAADLWLRGNRLKYVDNTMPYINQHIAFVIPPGAELSSFEKFIKPLDKWTWMLLILFFAVAFLVIYVVGKLSPNVQDFIFGYGVRKPYMNILVAIFGGSQKVVPHRNFARSLLMMFLIFCLVMRTLYTGSLYRFLRAKVYHKEAQSIDEMIQRDYKFYTVSSILDLFKGQSRISPRLEVFPAAKRGEILNQIASNPSFKGALLRSLTGTLYNNQLHFNETQHLICKEIFMMFPVVLYVTKDFYLISALNEKIQLLQASGLIDYWHTEIIDPRYLKVIESKEPKGIKFEYLSGCFFIWAFSCCFSSVVFVGEVFGAKWERNSEKKKMMKAINM